MVFANSLLIPFFVVKGTINVDWGIVVLIAVEHPVGGAWGRLQTICIAAMQKDWRGRTRTNEPGGVPPFLIWGG